MLQNRAWVGVLGMDTIGDFSVAGQPFSLQVSFQNTGHVAALDVETNNHTLDRYPTSGEVVARAQEPHAHGVISPQTIVRALAGQNIVLKEGDLAKIKAGTLTLYIFGRVDYTDIFGTHRTTYCGEFHGFSTLGVCPGFNTEE